MNNDLISRSALKEELKECARFYDGVNVWVMKDELIGIIDNAPAVENVTVFCENADEKSIANLKAELQMVIADKRPQGEWKVYGRQGGIPITDYCSNCKYEMMWYKNKFNFCPNCGAKMQKGGAE